MASQALARCPFAPHALREAADRLSRAAQALSEARASATRALTPASAERELVRMRPLMLGTPTVATPIKALAGPPRAATTAL